MEILPRGLSDQFPALLALHLDLLCAAEKGRALQRRALLIVPSDQVLEATSPAEAPAAVAAVPLAVAVAGAAHEDSVDVEAHGHIPAFEA